MMRVFGPVGLVSVVGVALAVAGLAPGRRPIPGGTTLRGWEQGQGQRRLVLAAEGNEARYRVREQLAGVDFPNDAVGMTRAITGGIVLDERGGVVPAESRIVVDITALRSDKERRDRFIQRRTLQTDSFPTVVLVPTALNGLRHPLPSSGPLAFELVGDLTVHGVTRPTTWQVNAVAQNGGWSGTATTTFAFPDFGLTKPRVAVVLTVADSIRLEYDFHLVPDSAGGVGGRR
jgi:polyisoprenoid-binding protein YceI